MLTLGVWLIVLILAIAHWPKIREFIRVLIRFTANTLAVSWALAKFLVSLVIVVGLVGGGFYAALSPWREAFHEAKVYGTEALIGGLLTATIIVGIFFLFSKSKRTKAEAADEAA